ncbi:MAG TPA: METTL5 family protein [Thermoplasmata archaeon]|nr:METTL5 family protein [Thermoplasmata archaeon]
MTRAPTPRRWSALERSLESVPPFAHGRPELEQVATPADAAAQLLRAACDADDLVDRAVVDLGAGTGRLAIGAALLGARSVTAVEVDPAAIALGRRSAEALGGPVRWVASDVAAWQGRADTVLMNPPFGAQRRGADRPFWAAAFATAQRAIYAFALADSRTFIARRAVERAAYVDATRPVPWALPRVFPHHRRERVALAVDLWAIRITEPP